MKSIIWFLLCLCGFSIFSGSINAAVVNGSTGQIITLSPGWNTFSTPKVLDSITFQSGGTGLYFYSLTSTGWQAIVPTKETIKPLEGFMINNTNSNTSNINLTYKSNLSPMEMIFQKQLHAGWNILGITTINNPFGSIGSNITMSLDFTRSSEGGLNYANKVSSTYYSKVGFPIISNLLGGESYGIFMQTPMLYAGVQNQTIGPGYTPTTIIASLAVAGGTITAGKTNQLFTRVNISAGEQDIIVNGFTLTRSGSVELTKRLQNVKIYKNGVSVGTVSISADKITVNGLTDILTSGNTQTYELKADILLDINNSIGLKIDSIADVRATEVATGYDTSIVLGNSSIDIIFSPIEFTFTKTSTGDLIVTPGTLNIKLFNSKIQSTTPVSVRKLSVSSANTGTGITAFVYEQLTVKLNGSEIGTLTSLSGAQSLTVSFVVDSANPAVLTVEGSTKNNTNIAPSSNQFTVTLTEVRDSSNNPITNIGAGSSLIGDKVTVQNAEVEIKNATVAAPSTSRIYSSAEQEIGRFALTARNGIARLQSIALTASTTNGTIQQIANSTSSAKLVDVATGLEVSATVTISGNNITFSSMNDTIGKDVTKNYKVMLGVSSIDLYYGMTATLGTVLPATFSIVRDSNSANITPTGSATTKSYTVGTVAPTVLVTAINENTFKVRITNPDSNTGVTLTSTKFDFRTALPGNTTYTAIACLRDLGSTNTCGGVGTSGSSSFPALSQTLAVAGLTTNMTAEKNGGYVEFEVYMTSPYLLPTGAQLQVALTQLNYTVGPSADSESYVGTTGASASFTK